MSSGIRRITPLAALLIVTLTTGCDNFEWGGFHISIVRPAPRGKLATAAAAPGERLPEGPVLYYVRVDSAGRRGVIHPVAEIQGGGMRALRPVNPAVYEPAFIDQHFHKGTRFTLFHHGQPSGNLTIDSAGPAGPDACQPLPQAFGNVRLGRNKEAREFLALLRPRKATARTPVPEPPSVDRRMRLLAPILANQMLDVRGASLPTSWRHALAQLTPFPVDDSPDAAFAATFLVGDTLAPGFDDVGESLFFIAVPHAQVGYDTVFVRFADYSRTGKSAPRLIDYLDWNHDGRPDLLLDLYTTGRTRFMAVGETDQNWHVLLDQNCRPRTAPDTTTAAGAAQRATPPPTPARPTTTPPRRRRQPRPQNTLPAIKPHVGLAGSPAAADTTQRHNTVRDTTARDTTPRDTTPRDTTPPPTP